MASSRKSPATEPVAAAVAACIDRHVAAGERVCVALSGGVDSVVLLHALVRARSPRLSALHVHHGLHPHADRWAAFCADLCGRLAVPFACVRVAVERGSRDGLEAAARRARHAAFAAADADWVMLAHQRDDQAETMLFNLLRGSGLAGAAAMRERSGRLLRPLLDVDRNQIAAYARAHALAWIEDDSNSDTRFSRNFLRHEVFPEVARRFPAAAKNLAAAATRFAEGLDLLDALAQSDLGGTEDFPLSCALLAGLGEARARNALRYLLAKRGVQIPGEARLRETLRQLLEAAPDRHPQVRFGAHRIVRRRGAICLEKVGAGGTAARAGQTPR